MSDQECTIQRCPHDKENPYVMINRDLLRDKNISLECRGLISYLLSFDKSWIIRVPVIIREQNLSKNKLYRIINEAIDSGYLKRDEYLEQGKKRFKYFVSETPKFKKSLLCPQNQDTEKQDPENEDSKNKQPITSLHSVIGKKEQVKEKVHSAEASGLASNLLKAIKKTKANFREPNLKKWTIEIDRMIRIDKIDPGRIQEILDWLPTNDFWKTNILCSEKLRLQFDRLEIARQKDQKELWIEKNKRFVFNLKNENSNELKHIKIARDYVINIENNKDIMFDMNPESFKNVFMLIAGIRYVED